MTIRHYILFSIFIFITVCILSILFLLQVVRGDEYRSIITQNYIGGVDKTPVRGSILFKTKDGLTSSGVFSTQGFSIAVEPSRVTLSPDTLIETLQEVGIPVDEDGIRNALQLNRPYVPLNIRITREEREILNEKGVRGLVYEPIRWRTYPWGTLAAHILGFAGPSIDEVFKGHYGLEKYHNYRLAGDKNKHVNSFANVLLNLREDIQEYPANIVTTIDPNIQLSLEKELSTIAEKWGGTKTTGIIVDPVSGKIFALASNPTYDPSAYNEIDDFSVFVNPIVEERYELGSILKPLTIAMGIDSGLLSKQFKYNDYTGSRTIDTHTIYNFDKKGRGSDIDIQSILSNSLNTGIAVIVEEIKPSTLVNYVGELELGSETGVDLPGEISSDVRNLVQSPRLIEAVTAGYGHGIALTPIATVRALSSIANGGTLNHPHITESVNENGKTVRIGREEIKQKRVFDERTTRYVTDLLVHVVDEALLGGTVKNERYRIAAKTGTALLVNSKEGGYYDDRVLHSFFGYFPAYDPQFLIFLLTVDPKEVRYASETLTAPFIRLTDSLINYYRIPPDR